MTDLEMLINMHRDALPQYRTKYGLPSHVQFCTRCVISNQRPSSVSEFQHTAESLKPTINFDAEGVCDACRVSDTKRDIDWSERESRLNDCLERFRSRNGSYDCILPGSGGKDSFYAAHVLRSKYGMHPLLVTWAPHISTEWGRRNLERWQSIADHFMVTPNRETHRLLTRLAVENLFHPFQPFIIGQKALAPKLAATFGIPLVFYGEDESEYGNAPNGSPKRSAQYHAPTGPLYLSGISVEELRGRYKLQECDLAPYMPANPAVLERKQVEVHYLGYYLKWHPQSCYYYAVEHGNFEPSPYRTPGTYSTYNSIDDKMDDFHYWTTYQKFGIGRATYDAAQEIRSSDIDREEGVALVRKFDGEWPARFAEEVNDYLSISGFAPMTDERWDELAHQFRSPHLWDGDKLRHVVT